MPNGIKRLDTLDSLRSVNSSYCGNRQPGTCKYWILDLGISTHKAVMFSNHGSCSISCLWTCYFLLPFLKIIILVENYKRMLCNKGVVDTQFSCVTTVKIWENGRDHLRKDHEGSAGYGRTLKKLS